MDRSFSAAEAAACAQLVKMALHEDLGQAMTQEADITSASFIEATKEGASAIVARQPGVLAGLPAAAMVFARLDPTLKFEPLMQDGAPLKPGDRIATVAGLMPSILAAERTALNFVQQLGGIATLTRRYVDVLGGLPVKILDTRKTPPGWRLLAKYAVRQGGGHNHRMGLDDMVLIKDNHWAAMPAPRNLYAWVTNFRRQRPEIAIEIEVETPAQLDEALVAGPDIVLLDNMPLDTMRQAVKRRNALAPQVLLEASGGVTLETVRAIAETGVDRISVGALTHSAPALDIALDFVT